jgi:hypothetical protein
MAASSEHRIQAVAPLQDLPATAEAAAAARSVAVGRRRALDLTKGVIVLGIGQGRIGIYRRRGASVRKGGRPVDSTAARFCSFQKHAKRSCSHEVCGANAGIAGKAGISG